MKLPILKKLVVEDFPAEVQSWIGDLIYAQNQLSQALISTLDQGVTANDNFGQIYVADFKSRVTPSPYPFTFTNNLGRPPVGLQVIRVVQVGTNIVPDGPVYAAWTVNSQGKIQVNNITGLTTTPDTHYQVSLLLF